MDMKIESGMKTMEMRLFLAK